MAKAEFYDVKARAKVQAEISGKAVYGEKGRERYALRGKTDDGRNLTKFVKKAVWEETDVPKV